MDSKLKALRKALRNDSRFQNLKDKFDSLSEFDVDFVGKDKFIRQLHSSRSVRVLTKHSPESPSKIFDALMQDQSVRSNLTETMLEVLRSKSRLDAAISSLRDYFLIQYSQQLKQVASTKAERVSFIDISLRDFLSYIDRCDELTLKCKVIIEDIDKASYALRNSLEAVKLLTRPEA